MSFEPRKLTSESIENGSDIGTGRGIHHRLSNSNRFGEAGKKQNTNRHQ